MRLSRHRTLTWALVLSPLLFLLASIPITLHGHLSSHVQIIVYTRKGSLLRSTSRHDNHRKSLPNALPQHSDAALDERQWPPPADDTFSPPPSTSLPPQFLSSPRPAETTKRPSSTSWRRTSTSKAPPQRKSPLASFDPIAGWLIRGLGRFIADGNSFMMGNTNDSVRLHAAKSQARGLSRVSHRKPPDVPPSMINTTLHRGACGPQRARSPHGFISHLGRPISPVVHLRDDELLVVDVVYTHVNGSVPAWRDALTAAKGSGIDWSRFRDFGEIVYSLRSVAERMCAHTRDGSGGDDVDAVMALRDCGGLARGRVFIVVASAAHVPGRLQRCARELREPTRIGVNGCTDELIIVPHSELLPGAALPTFNSRALEAVLHRIPGLSEHFLYFNNDMFLGRGSAGGRGKLHMRDLFHAAGRVGERGVAGGGGGKASDGVTRWVPKLLVETSTYSGRTKLLLSSDVQITSDSGCDNATANSFPLRPAAFFEMRIGDTGDDYKKFLDFNKQLIFERLDGIFPFASFSHTPRLFNRKLLEQMLDVDFADVVAQTRLRPFRSITDTSMPFLYMHYVAAMVCHEERVTNTSAESSWCPYTAKPAGKQRNLFFPLRNSPTYYFAMLRDGRTLKRATEELLSRRNVTVFITVNDDFASEGRGAVHRAVRLVNKSSAWSRLQAKRHRSLRGMHQKGSNTTRAARRASPRPQHAVSGRNSTHRVGDDHWKRVRAERLSRLRGMRRRSSVESNATDVSSRVSGVNVAGKGVTPVQRRYTSPTWISSRTVTPDVRRAIDELLRGITSETKSLWE